MRSYAVILALAAVATAQSASETVPQLPTPTGVDPASSSLAAKINECLAKCDSSDVNCQARCVDVPSPNDDQANDNIECAKNCDQGDGSEADTIAFGECLLKCRDEHYFSLGHGTPNPTNASNDSNGDNSGDEATATGGSSPDETGSSTEEQSGNESGSPSESASGAESSDDGSGAMTLSALSSVSLFGLVAAFFL